MVVKILKLGFLLSISSIKIICSLVLTSRMHTKFIALGGFRLKFCQFVMLQVAAIEIKTSNFYEVSVPEKSTVGQLKDIISSSYELERQGMRIIWNERFAEDNEALGDIGIHNDSCISIYVHGLQAEVTEEEIATESGPIAEPTSPAFFNVGRMNQILRAIYRNIASFQAAKTALDHQYGDLFSEHQKLAVMMLCGGFIDDRAKKALEGGRMTDAVVKACFECAERQNSNFNDLQVLAQAGAMVQRVIDNHGIRDIFPPPIEQMRRTAERNNYYY